ncbi:MAG: phage tail sheath family protein, partial [Pseudomonadota bacterium]
MAEFHEYFGYGPTPLFEIKDVPAEGGIDSVFTVAEKDYYVQQVAGTDGGEFMLYSCMKTFFQNGGGPCYIVSVGDYKTALDPRKLTAGIQALVREQEPTMVVVPDAVLLTHAQCISVQQASLMHCGKMMNRISLLDVHGGERDRQSPHGDPIDAFRDALGINHLDYAAAYYPWVNTSIVQDSDLDYENISNRAKLQTLLREELGIKPAPAGGASPAPGGDADAGGDQSAAPKEDPKAVQRRQAVDDIALDADGWVDRVAND